MDALDSADLSHLDSDRRSRHTWTSTERTSRRHNFICCRAMTEMWISTEPQATLRCASTT